MFGRGHKDDHDGGGHKKRGKPVIFVIFRLMLSLTMMCVLALGVYQAMRYFSGVDPIKMDPKTILLTLATSEETEQIIHALFNIKVPSQIASKIPGTNDDASETGEGTSISLPAPADSEAAKPGSLPVLKVALVSDSHNDNTSLDKALKQSRKLGAKFVIGLGDYTDVGSPEELSKAKDIFQASGLPYYLTAGDHDLWAARDQGNNAIQHYSQVFGTPYQSFKDSNVRFLLIYNSDNYSGVDSSQMMWLDEELSKIASQENKAVLAFVHEPLFHPSSDHIMGKTKPELKQQARELVTKLKGEGSVVEVFAGDTHFFGRYIDPVSGIRMTTVGALTSQRNTQSPRFSMVDVYSDGSYNVADIEVE